MIANADRTPGHRLRQAWRRLVGTGAQAPLILMYHRIAQDAQDPWQLCVSPSNFAAQMEIVRRRHRPMRLGELTAALTKGRCPPGAVVVTFDDGYRDNLESALPVLEACDVPATVFCTAGFIDREESFWWDQLAALLLGPQRLPPRLALDVGARHWHHELGPATSYSVAERASDRSPPAGSHQSSPRLGFYREVWGWLRPLAEAERAEAMQAIANWCADAAAGPGEPPKALSGLQLSALAASPLIDVGAHSITHAALPALTPEQQRREVGQSKTLLENLVGRPVQHFAYPFGDQSLQTASLVREAGFHSACTTESAVVRRTTDLYQLPRIAVGDWSGDRFATMLQSLA